MSAEDQQDIYRRFREAVNMAPAELERWLGREESRSVGQKRGGNGESTGHEAGRRIVEVLRTKKSELSEADYEHMRKVSGYVARHLKQRPSDPEHSRWRYSLMNWGHDPMK